MAPHLSYVLMVCDIVYHVYFVKETSFTWTLIEALAVGSLGLTLATAYNVVLAPQLSSLRHLPKAPQGPLLKRLFKEPNSIDFLRWIEEVPNDGLIRFFGVLNAERILVTTTAGTKIVHDGDTKDFSRPAAAKVVLCRLTGGGIFAAEGQEHALQRKALLPAFKYRNLKELHPLFWQKTMELMKALECLLGQAEKTIDVTEWVSYGTLDAIGIAAFGFDFGSIANPQSELVGKYRTAFLPSTSAARVRVLAHLLPAKLLVNLPIKYNRDAKACISTVRRTLREVVQRRRDETDAEKADYHDLLSVLLASPKFTNIEDIVSQCMAFLAAGHEASALALGWTLFELAKDVKRQQRLREEIRASIISPDSSHAFPAAKIEELPYLQAVVQETLRFWSPVPRQTRISPNATVIAGQRIPARTPLVVSFYAMNRATQNWGADADQWKPERWLGGSEIRASGGSTNRYAFATFSHGARSCIGEKFAYAEILIFLAGLVGRFEWHFRDIPGHPSGTLHADHVSTVMLKVAGGLRLEAKVVPGW